MYPMNELHVMIISYSTHTHAQTDRQTHMHTHIYNAWNYYYSMLIAFCKGKLHFSKEVIKSRIIYLNRTFSKLLNKWVITFTFVSIG